MQLRKSRTAHHAIEEVERVGGRTGGLRSRLYPEQKAKKKEMEVSLDPELDGDSLDPSDYEECLFSPSVNAITPIPVE